MSIGVDPETNPLHTGVDNPGSDEDIEQIEMENHNSYDSSSRHGSVDPTGHHRTDEETSFGGDISNTMSLVEARREKAWEAIKREFPNAEASLIADYNKNGRLTVQKSTAKRPYIVFTKNQTTGEQQIAPKLPNEIIKALGPRDEKIVKINEEEIAIRNKKISELQDQLEKTSDEHIRDHLNQNIAEEQDVIAQLEIANEKMEQRMTLRDRVKAIFKKYGFTVLAVASAVGVVIGVIVANLKNGLTSLGKGVGNGLKTIGERLSEILPGLVGAIASFVFRTAGEVVGFLTKNAWLLIVGVVFYLVEQFKKKKYVMFLCYFSAAKYTFFYFERVS